MRIRTIAIGMVILIAATAVAIAADGSNRYVQEPKIEIDANGVTFLWFEAGLDYKIVAEIEDEFGTISYKEFTGTLDYWQGAQAYTLSFIHVDETSSTPTGMSLKLDEGIIDDDQFYPITVTVFGDPNEVKEGELDLNVYDE
ncbi:MAG: hypothetical protein E4G94_00470 [ANME-2 cluster archaeon]|nr:MAG: hypothetical protein E4G94_00470 [ANME-2 cluster archaeon]